MMRYNVLIVEDDRHTADSFAAQLGALGHIVSVAYGPRMALAQLNQVIPDLIFMDINMPGVNGLEVLRFLRRDPATAPVPVVIVSAEEQPETIRAAYEAGACGYILKPPTFEELEAAINKAMGTVPPPPTRPAAR